MANTVDEKANELIKKFYRRTTKFYVAAKGDYVFDQPETLKAAKACAIICVEQIEQVVYSIPITDETLHYRQKHLDFWNEVKQHLLKS